MKTGDSFAVRIDFPVAAYIRGMAMNNGISLKAYTHDLLERAIKSEGGDLLEWRTPSGPLVGSVPLSEVQRRRSLCPSDYRDLLSPIDGEEPT